MTWWVVAALSLKGKIEALDPPNTFYGFGYVLFD